MGDQDDPTEAPPQSMMDFAFNLRDRFIAGLQDKLGEDGQRRAAALHTASLIMGPGQSPVDLVVLAEFMMGGES